MPRPSTKDPLYVPAASTKDPFYVPVAMPCLLCLLRLTLPLNAYSAS